MPHPAEPRNEPLWEVHEWLSTGLLAALQANPSDKYFHAFELAKALNKSGLPVPGLGFLFDLGVWTSNDGDPEKTNPELLGSYSDAIRLYRDQVVGRIMVDHGCRSLRHAISGLNGTEYYAAVSWLLGQWYKLGLWKGKVLGPCKLSQLLGITPTQLETTSIEAWQKRTDKKKQELLKTMSHMSKYFETASELAPDYFSHMIANKTAMLSFAESTGLQELEKAKKRLDSKTSNFTSLTNNKSPELAIDQFIDDDFPVGGYSSLSNRGRMESLLPSQLAFWDYPVGDSDLFTWKYAHDELWYYSRDENALHRQKLELRIILQNSLAFAQMMDRNHGQQNLTLLVGSLLFALDTVENTMQTTCLTVRWIFESPLPDLLAEIQSLLKVLLGTRIQQGGHHVESMANSIVLSQLSEKTRGVSVRSIFCHSFHQNNFSAIPDILDLTFNETGLLALDWDKESFQNPNPVYSSYHWLAEFLPLWWSRQHV